MSKQFKIVAGFAVLVIVLSGAIMIFLMYSLGIFDAGATKLYQDAVVEGPEFGKTTDQNGCMQRGSDRLKDIAKPTIIHTTASHAFMSGCFETARKTPDFCSGVPSAPYFEWIDAECQKLGRSDEACRSVMDEKHRFCIGS